MARTGLSGREAMLERLATRLLSRSAGLGHPLRVGIDGRSTAGKTHLADELAAALRARGTEVLRSSIDEFHRPGHKFRSQTNAWTPESRVAEGLDYEAFRTCVLEPLGPGRSRRIRLRMFDSYRDEFWPEEWSEADPEAILISDAGHGFMPELRDHWDYRIWLEVPAATMVARAIERDVAWAVRYGEVASAEQIRRRYEEFWIPTDELYQARHDPAGSAHCVIDNTDLVNPRVLRI